MKNSEMQSILSTTLALAMGSETARSWENDTAKNRGRLVKGRRVGSGDKLGGTVRYFLRAIAVGVYRNGGNATMGRECIDEMLGECCELAIRLYDPSKASFPTFLYGVLLNECGNWVKSNLRYASRVSSMDSHADRDGAGADQARSRFLADHGASVDSGNPVDTIVHNETVAGMVRAMGPEDRQIAEMLASGLPQTVVAERLGMKTTTLGMRIGRIREKVAAAR